MNIYAWTPKTDPYPQYVSANVDEKGQLLITVRGPATNPMQQYAVTQCGPTACAQMPDEELGKLADAIYVYLAKKGYEG